MPFVRDATVNLSILDEISYGIITAETDDIRDDVGIFCLDFSSLCFELGEFHCLDRAFWEEFCCEILRSLGDGFLFDVFEAREIVIEFLLRGHIIFDLLPAIVWLADKAFDFHILVHIYYWRSPHKRRE